MSGIGHIGRVLFTDNFYTSLAVMTLYTQYKMLVVGTMCLTKKKSRCQNDYPFHQMSNSALKKLNRGWMRTAITSIKDNSASLLYKVQATVWKDCKQVAFLHNFMVGVEDNSYKVTRKDKKLGRYVYVLAPLIQKFYARYYSGVDKKDRDTADWGVSVRTSRYLNRFVFWVFDAAIFTAYRIVCYLAEREKPEWKKYWKKKEEGSYFKKMLP